MSRNTDLSLIFPAIMFLMLLGLPAFIITDICTGKSEGTYSTVIDKQYIPEKDWDTFDYDSEKETFVVNHHHKDEEWNLYFVHKGTDVVIGVSRSFWRSHNVGETLPIMTRRGGITGSAYGYHIQNGEAP